MDDDHQASSGEEAACGKSPGGSNGRGEGHLDFEAALDGVLQEVRRILLAAHRGGTLPGAENGGTAGQNYENWDMLPIPRSIKARRGREVRVSTDPWGNQRSGNMLRQHSGASFTPTNSRSRSGSRIFANLASDVDECESMFLGDTDGGKAGGLGSNNRRTSRASAYGAPRRNAKVLVSLLNQAEKGGGNPEMEDEPFKESRIKEWVTQESKKPFADLIVGFAIILNAITIGMSVDLMNGWWGWIAIDTAFAAFFLFEMAIKMLKRGVRGYFCKDSVFWSCFEFLLVVLAWVEVLLSLVQLAAASDESGGFMDMMGSFRVMRLLRVARVLRVVRLGIFTELMMMINGAVGGFRTLLWSQVLIAFFLYVLALVLRELLGDYALKGGGAEHFDTLGASYFTSFRCLVAGDCNNDQGRPIFPKLIRSYGWGFAVIYCGATVLMTFGLFNVIVAIYVENTVAAAKHNDSRQKQLRLTDQQMFTDKVLRLVDFIWERHQERGGRSAKSIRNMGLRSIQELSKISITPELFEELRKEKEFQETLHALDIADEDQFDLFDTLDVDGGGTIDLEELIQGIAKLRGDARRSDIVSVGLMVRNLQAGLNEFQDFTQRTLQRQAQSLQRMQADHARAAQLTVLSRALPQPQADDPSALRSPRVTKIQDRVEEERRQLEDVLVGGTSASALSTKI